MKIVKLLAREILASGAYPTLEVKTILDDGSQGEASVPYGASAGSHEATVLVDEDPNRYQGKGMLKAVAKVKEIIAPALQNQDAQNQRAIDEKLITLDGTENKSSLGGNTTLAVSLAVAKAVAKSQQKPFYQYIADSYQIQINPQELPQPMAVVIEGGKHADNSTDLQEYCLTSIGNDSPTEGIRKVIESYHHLKNILQKENLSTNVGNEGAFAPTGIKSNEAPLKYLVSAIQQAGFEAGRDLGISLDAAASEFYLDQKYQLKLENKTLTSQELISYYKPWLDKYPIVTIEDMLAEDDWDNWVKLNELAQTKKIELIGDDLTVTNSKRLQKAIDLKAISAILIKLNQIGTLTETVNCCLLAKKHRLMTVPSHRGGGETTDTSMVDLAVAVGSKYIKVGPSRGERVVKYNRLMEIEQELKN